MDRSLLMPSLAAASADQDIDINHCPIFLSEAQEAAGLHRPGTQVSGQRAARSAFREPQTTCG